MRQLTLRWIRIRIADVPNQTLLQPYLMRPLESKNVFWQKRDFRMRQWWHLGQRHTRKWVRWFFSSCRLCSKVRSRLQNKAFTPKSNSKIWRESSRTHLFKQLKGQDRPNSCTDQFWIKMPFIWPLCSKLSLTRNIYQDVSPPPPSWPSYHILLVTFLSQIWLGVLLCLLLVTE